MILQWLWTKNTMVILVVVYVKVWFYILIWHGRDGCGKVVDTKFRGYFGCGVCKGQFLLSIRHGGDSFLSIAKKQRSITPGRKVYQISKTFTFGFKC